MTTRTVRFLDPTRAVVATARVTAEADHFGGTIDLGDAPPELRALLTEFEEVVTGQMFAFLDDVQRRIAAWRLTAAFDDGTEMPVADLQVFPDAGDVSFRPAAVQAAARSA